MIRMKKDFSLFFNEFRKKNVSARFIWNEI